jgi:NADH-quinone oxidoreductase subunit M
MGMILGVIYMLYLYRRVIFGRLTKEDLRSILDLSPREVTVFAPLIAITLWMGIFPTSFSSFWEASVAAMVQQHTAAVAASNHLADAGQALPWPPSQAKPSHNAGETKDASL